MAASVETMLVLWSLTLREGKASCGVARQYTGSAGKITNCQIGVFAAYVSRHGHALIDRQLYLPRDWAADRRRRAGAHVPEEAAFATKPALAAGMIERAVCAHMPFSWVSGDSVYGVGEIEMLLWRLGKGYVLGITGSHHIWSWNTRLPISGTAADIAHRLEPSCWRRLSAGAGTKGERVYDWVHLELATLAAAEFGADVPGLWTRGLLIRRSRCDQGLAFFTTWSPAGTPIETLARVEGARWAIEDAFETAKTELGLDHNETRSWHGWHRHVSLVMLAFVMLAAIRRRANERPAGGQKKGAAQSRRSSAGRSRKSAASPPDWPRTKSSQALSSRGQPGDAPIRPQPEQPISNEGCNCNVRACLEFHVERAMRLTSSIADAA